MADNDKPFDPLNPKRPGTNDEGYYDATHPPPADVPNPYHIGVTVTDVGDWLPPDPKAPAATNLAREVGRRTAETLIQEGVPRIIANTIAAVGASFQLICGGIATAMTYAVAAIAEPVGLAFLGGISKLRKGLDPIIPNLAAEVLSELTGAEIKSEHVPTGKGFADHLARVTAVGDQLHNLLTKEFTPEGTLSPEQGAKAARAFTGFNINFGIGTALIAILGEIESLGKLEQIRELGVEVSRNLGLGRLHRQALQPLIHTTIAAPYQSFLNEKYRPTRLSVGQALKAYFRKAMDEPTLRDELAHEGYTTKRIDQLIEDARPVIDTADALSLYFKGNKTIEQTRAMLSQRGWEDFEVDMLVDARRPQLEKNEIIHLYEGGEIELPEALELLQQLGYDDKTAHRVITAYELAHQPSIKIPKIHTKHLSIGELRKAYIDTNIDLFEFQDYALRLGYSPDDVQILTLDLLVDAKHHQELESARAARDASKGTKTKPTP